MVTTWVADVYTYSSRDSQGELKRFLELKMSTHMTEIAKLFQSDTIFSENLFCRNITPCFVPFQIYLTNLKQKETQEAELTKKS